MKKLNFFGIGPKIGMVAIPYFFITLWLSYYFYPIFSFGNQFGDNLWIIGITFTTSGITALFFSILFLIKAVKKTILLTSDLFVYCQNPMYASIILMILPGLALMLNSWLILTTCLVAYYRFKKFIHLEYAELEEIFGEPYREYKKNTPELFPFPFNKLFQ